MLTYFIIKIPLLWDIPLRFKKLIWLLRSQMVRDSSSVQPGFGKTMTVCYQMLPFWASAALHPSHSTLKKLNLERDLIWKHRFSKCSQKSKFIPPYQFSLNLLLVKFVYTLLSIPSTFIFLEAFFWYLKLSGIKWSQFYHSNFH